MAKLISAVLTIGLLCIIFIQSNAAPAEGATENKTNGGAEVTTTESAKVTTPPKAAAEAANANSGKAPEGSKDNKEVKPEKAEEHPAVAGNTQPQSGNKTDGKNAGVTVFANYVLFFAGVLICSRL